MKILELNAIRKDWRNKIKFALCIPSIYRVGMSSLALHTIYNILNSYEDVCCERVFLPPNNTPPYSLESNQPLSKFDFIAFSLHYEINYTNVIKILLDSNIPVESKNRGSNLPIIIAGGPVMANPLPLSFFIDLFVIGDFEPVAPKILEVYREVREKQAFLEQIKNTQGVYIPNITEGTVKKTYDKHLENCPHALFQIIPQLEHNTNYSPSFGKSFLLEVSRGCGRQCRFCLEGIQGLPFRFRSLDKIQDIISQGIGKTNVNRVSLIGSGLSDHPKLEDICWSIVNKGLGLSISSLRVDCITDDLLQALVKGQQKTLTIAPETGSDRLLDVIHKGFSIDEILSAINRIKNSGMKNLKLYFMINLPTETSEDITAIGDMVQKINKIGFKGSNLRLSINCFIPKSHTPFQWEPSVNLEVSRNKIKELKKIIKMPAEFLDPQWAQIQTYLSLADSNIDKAILLVAKLGGSLGAWKKSLRISNYNHKIYDTNSDLPWDFIQFEFNKKKLREEYEKVIG